MEDILFSSLAIAGLGSWQATGNGKKNRHSNRISAARSVVWSMKIDILPM
jgi:hypothetical protein